ncbi:hypothetical protein ACHAW6_001333 [Cyclotella cf. meneghiniana]
MIQANAHQIIRLVQIFSVKLILEVCGGAGAVWGFSEAIGLRHDGTVWFWRPCALAVGAMFWARWLCQIRGFAIENKIELRFWMNSRHSTARTEEAEGTSLISQNNSTYNNK